MSGKDQLMPLYTATKSLNVTYAFNYGLEGATVNVEGANTHSVLYAGCRDMIAFRSGMTFGTGRHVYPRDIDDVNIGTAAITLLYTDTTTEEGYLGQDVEQRTFYLSALPLPQRIVCSADFYTPGTRYSVSTTKAPGRDSGFNSLLTQRVNAFSAIAGRYDLVMRPKPVSSLPELNGEITGEMFHDHFHHSEQAMMHYLSSVVGIQSLVSTLQQCNAQYLYGIVLDIYTQRVLCCNCNACLLGMQNTDTQGFLYDLSQLSKEGRIESRPKLMLSTRVSASQKAGYISQVATDNKDSWHQYNPDAENKVFQAENRSLGTEKIINDSKFSLNTYKGCFFTSKETKSALLEERIRITVAPQASQHPGSVPVTRKLVSRDVQTIKTELNRVGLGINEIAPCILEYCGIPKLFKK